MYIMCLSRGLDAMINWIDEFDPVTPIAFIPNAGDTYENPYFVEESKKRIELLGLKTKVIDLRTLQSAQEFSSAINSCSGIFVAGGNTFNLLRELYRTGSLEVLRDAIKGGLPYFGESAGAVLLYKTLAPVEMIDSPDDVPGFDKREALGIVDFITLPHINREKYAELFSNFYNQYSGNHRIERIRDDEALITRDGKSIEKINSAIREIE